MGMDSVGTIFLNLITIKFLNLIRFKQHISWHQKLNFHSKKRKEKGEARKIKKGGGGKILAVDDYLPNKDHQNDGQKLSGRYKELWHY